MRATKLLILVVAGLALVGCDDSPATPADAGSGDAGTTGTDSGTTGTDSGPMTGMDAGSTDPCIASGDNAIASLGCNGGVYGSTPMENEIGGPCTTDAPAGAMPVPGTCNPGGAGASAVCAAGTEGATTGSCFYECTAGSSYVSTGGCPTGTRCFDLSDIAICFRDCNSAADCFPDETCDSEGSCVMAPMDGGTATPDAGMTDAGAPLPDASPPSPDAGTPLPEAGAPPPDAGPAPTPDAG